MVEMDASEFEAIVAEAIDALEPQVAAKLSNVIFIVEDLPEDGSDDLLGFYDGVPLTERDGSEWGMLPDRIHIFRLPTLAICETVEEVRDEVTITVRHEIGHFFGIDDSRLHELGWA